jgi:hypothetical protein
MIMVSQRLAEQVEEPARDNPVNRLGVAQRAYSDSIPRCTVCGSICSSG